MIIINLAKQKDKTPWIWRGRIETLVGLHTNIKYYNYSNHRNNVFGRLAMLISLLCFTVSYFPLWSYLCMWRVTAWRVRQSNWIWYHLMSLLQLHGLHNVRKSMRTDCGLTEVPFRHLPWRTEENHKKNFTHDNVVAEIRTRHVPHRVRSVTACVNLVDTC